MKSFVLWELPWLKAVVGVFCVLCTQNTPLSSVFHGDSQIPKSFVKLVLGILPALVALFLLHACAAGPSNEQMRLDMEPFLHMAENAACADLRNQLYVIDDQFVFWATEGQCNDAGYAYILYGATPDEKLCTLEDSMMGPRSTCQPDLAALFETIQQNLDHPNLGLDQNHTVVEVMLGQE